METRPPLAAILDAQPLHAHFESPIMLARAKALGKALHDAHIGMIARMGSATIASVLSESRDLSMPAVALSPAASRHEHLHAFRLPDNHTPIIFTGRGALGADTVALHSSHTLIVIGSHEGTLENILRLLGDYDAPVGILTDEATDVIHERVRVVMPSLASRLFVSHDPGVLVREVAAELRRRTLSVRHAAR